MNLELQPITYREACAFIAAHHRHHDQPQGQAWAVAVNDGTRVVGVATVGRPVARRLGGGYVAEVTRCCTDSTPHVASKLYAACWRAGKAMGYRAMFTYTLEGEAGVSLQAAGWRCVGPAGGGSWNKPSRPRVDHAPTGPKRLWVIGDWDARQRVRLRVQTKSRANIQAELWEAV